MAKLYFKVGSDVDKVIQLRQEIAKLKQELMSMDVNKAPAAAKALQTQIGAATQEFNKLTTEAAKAGAVMENDFKSKIYQGSQAVNGFTQKIINQKAVIKDVEADVRRLGESYRSSLKNNPLSASGKLSEYTSAKKALDEEKASLFGLTQQQANAHLSVKKLRDEYALYRDESKETIKSNDGVGVSLTKAFALIGGAAAGKELVSNIIRVRGEFQAADTAIQTLLGSKEKADALMAQVKEYAKISPLEFSDVTQATQMMLGFNIEAEKVPQYLRAIGDISMGETGKFNSLTLAFSQMSATGKLMGQDLNQMINAGFNPLQQIANTTGKSIATLKEEMSKGAISAEMVQRAFMDATSAGGKFFGMSENASKTINGQLSMMHDAMDAALNEMGQKSEGVIMSGIQLTTKLVENYETVGKILSGLVITYGAYRAAVMLSTIATGKHTIAEVALTNVRAMARKAQMALNASMLSNPYVLLATVVVGAAAAMWAMSDNTNAAARAQKEYNEIKGAATQKEKEHKQKIEELLSVARDESLATLTRQKSLEELRKEYPKIFEKYDIEKLKLADILELKRQINEEDSNRSVEERKEDYSSLRETVANQQRYLQLFDNPDLRKNMAEKDKSIWKMFAENQSYVQVREEMEKNASKLKLFQKEVLEDSLSSYKSKLKNYSKEKLEAELNMARSSASKRNGFNVGGMMVKGGDLEGVISSINGALSEKKAPSTYKEDFNKAKTDWEDAKNKLSEIEKDKDDFTAKQYEEAKKRSETAEKAYKDLGGITGSALSKQENQSEKLRKDQEKYKLLMDKQKLDQVRSEEDLQMQVDDARIKTMDEGSKKTIAQMELNFEKEMQTIDRQKEDALRKKIEDARKEFEDNPENKKEPFDATGIELSDDDKKKYDALYKSEIESFEQDKQRMDFQHMQDYLKEHGTFQQKKLAIAKEYDEKIRNSQNEWEKKSLAKEQDTKISGLETDSIKANIDWVTVFGEFGGMFNDMIKPALEKAKEYVKTDKFKNSDQDSQKSLIDAINQMEKSLGGTGGLNFKKLGEDVKAYQLAEQNRILAIENETKAQEKLKKAQEDYEKAIKSGIEEEKQIAKDARDIAQQNANVASENVKNQTGIVNESQQNLGDTATKLKATMANVTEGFQKMASGGLKNAYSGIIQATNGIKDAIGDTSESLKEVPIVGWILSIIDVLKDGLSNLVGGLLDAVFNAVSGIIGDVLSGDLFVTIGESLVTGISKILDAITFGGFGSWVNAGESDETLKDDIALLSKSNEDLKKAIDNLAEKMDSASVADATDLYEQQKENLQKQQANTQEMMQRSGSAYSNGWIGIGGSHSSNANINDSMPSSEWSRISRIVGHTVNSASDFWKLTSEEMAKVATDATDLYSKIESYADDGYENAGQYMDSYIEYYKQLEELENAWREKLTSASFDTIRDDFKSALMDMEADTEEFAKNFEELMKNAIFESLMTGKYDKLIQDWYKDFSAAMEDGKLDENEQTDLKDRWDKIVKQGITERDSLYDTMGWDKSSSSSSQDSSKGGFQAMSQDTGEELNGRFTALQIAGEEAKNQSILQTQSLSILTVTSGEILSVGKEIRDIADETRTILANSYLELVQISENTEESAKYLKEIKSDIAEVKRNTKAMAG